MPTEMYKTNLQLKEIDEALRGMNFVPYNLGGRTQGESGINVTLLYCLTPERTSSVEVIKRIPIPQQEFFEIEYNGSEEILKILKEKIPPL